MEPVFQYLMLHPAVAFFLGTAVMWFFSAFVSGMPAPAEIKDAGWKYTWLYNSLHIAAANLDKFKKPNGAGGSTP